MADPSNLAPTFFPAPSDFRAWLEEHHQTADELLVGFHKVATGRPSLTWEESVEEALCFGWIDGVRRRLDEESYTIRFTPRRPGSHWSRKNAATIERLIEQGRMRPAGLAAWEEGGARASGKASFEQDEEPELPDDLARRFRADRAAWDHFQAQPPGYRRTLTHWVASAKREATRLRRLERVMEVSRRGERVDLMKPYG